MHKCLAYKFERRLARYIDFCNLDNEAETQGHGQQNHQAKCEAADRGNRLILQKIEQTSNQGKAGNQEQHRRDEDRRLVRKFESGRPASPAAITKTPDAIAADNAAAPNIAAPNCSSSLSVSLVDGVTLGCMADDRS
jgi:hypothetical protein